MNLKPDEKSVLGLLHNQDQLRQQCDESSLHYHSSQITHMQQRHSYQKIASGLRHGKHQGQQAWSNQCHQQQR